MGIQKYVKICKHKFNTHVKTQQTPNPAAQFPSEVPDFELHSEDVRQLPYIDVSDLAVH